MYTYGEEKDEEGEVKRKGKNGNPVKKRIREERKSKDEVE